MLYTMFVSYGESKDLYTCIGDQNYGIAFTLLAGNPCLTIYGYDKHHKQWVEFNPMDCPAVEDGEMSPIEVLGAGPDGKKDKKRIAILNDQLQDWQDSIA